MKKRRFVVKYSFVRFINVLLFIILMLFLAASVLDTSEIAVKTNFDRENMMTHIEKLSENGPRSIVHKEANEKAAEYIISQLEDLGFVNADTTTRPAYLVQEYVAIDSEGKNQNFYLKNVIVHIPANAPDATGDAVMFMGHFDSVPMGPGASDDGVACATMLEAIRYYSERMDGGYTMKNDLLFCFVNGEEYDLFGSRAFMNEFDGFDSVVDRIRFGTNLESRGTSGTVIMFETAKNNYNTMKLFSEVNRSLFTCSIATLVYDNMPNGTDFSSFKDAYQGLNMANISGGWNYHTQNDSPERVGKVCLSQQAEFVDGLIDRLSDYDLDSLYDAEESAIFFSYLNFTTFVYNRGTALILAAALILLAVLNIIFAIIRKEIRLAEFALGFAVIFIGLALSAGICYGFYYLFQYMAVFSGAINIHMVGTITYSNTAIVIGIALVALAMTALASYFGIKVFKLDGKDIKRAFAYLHAILGAVLSFVLPDASYLFVFSGIMLMINEIIVTLTRGKFEKFHLDLLATALYLPLIIPVVFLATSALGLTMAYVYGLVFALAIFNLGVDILPICKDISIFTVDKKYRYSRAMNPIDGIVTILLAASLIFIGICVIRPNASVNLQGKQNIERLPYDDALVYISGGDGEGEIRIYDLNSLNAFEKYAPDMKWNEEGDYYECGWTDMPQLGLENLSALDGNVLKVRMNTANSLVYLDLSDINAASFTVDDGKTAQTYSLTDAETYSIKLHSDCTVTVNGSADISYREVIIDYEPLIPEEYEKDTQKLHFNLWLTAEYSVDN